MGFEATSLSPDTLDRSRFDLITSFHDYVRRENGLLTSEFNRYFPHLAVCKFEPVTYTSPPMLTIGSRCDQKKFYGDDWAEQVHKSHATPDPQLELDAAAGYREAGENRVLNRYGVACEHCTTMIDVNGEAKWCDYVRHIAHVKTPEGGELFILTAQVLNLTVH